MGSFLDLTETGGWGARGGGGRRKVLLSQKRDSRLHLGFKGDLTAECIGSKMQL